MIELTEDKVYRVKNFAKHQNIKVKEKIEYKDADIINNETVVKEEVIKINNLETTSGSINNVDNISKEKTNKKKKKEKIFNIAMKDQFEDEGIVCTYDYDEKKPVRDGEILILPGLFDYDIRLLYTSII